MKSRIQWVCQLPDLVFFWKQNWANFSVFDLSFEYGTYKGRYLEIRFVVLGLGFDAEIAHTSQRDDWAAEMESKKDDAFEAIRARKAAETQREEYLQTVRASGGTVDDVPKLLGIIETMRHGGREWGIYTTEEVMAELG